VYDEGVKKSFTALAELKPGRYGKNEMLNASFDQLVPPAPPVQDAAACGGHTGRSHRGAGRGRATPPAPAYNPPKPPARATGDTVARWTHAQRSDAGQPRVPGDDADVPGSAGPYANLGLLYRNANQLAEAEASFQKATEHAPGTRPPGPSTA
jgi:hypothetical protein